MKQRRYFTETEMEEVWDRWETGESLNSIARSLERGHSAVQGMLSRTGGIRPAPKRRSRFALTLAEREEISRGVATGHSIRTIASQLGRAPSTVSREVNRNGGRRWYRASKADEAAWQRAHRPKTCKLARNPALARVVAEKLMGLWSPRQIAGWLKRTYPDDESFQVSHETIYLTLYIQARGALKKELIKHAHKLPRELYKSLTWDRGKEMAAHKRFSLATDVDVFFCDPQQPWQRGSNENTNGRDPKTCRLRTAVMLSKINLLAHFDLT